VPNTGVNEQKLFSPSGRAVRSTQSWGVKGYVGKSLEGRRNTK